MADVSDLNLETLDEESGAPPVSRVKNPAAARQIYQTLRQQDSARGLMRTKAQMILDGEPPYDQSVLNAKGQSSRTNCNWGDCRAVMDSVESGLIDMNVSVETLLYAPLEKTVVEDDETRWNLENILSEEASKTIRKWQNYDSRYLNLGRIAFWHGVGFGYFNDDIDWRFEVTGLGDFLIPNGTEASEEKIPVCTCLRWVEVHELYRYIQNEEFAEAAGWNVEAVKQAILHATPDSRTASGTINNWMDMAKELRSNDLGYSCSGRTAKVGLVHMWVQEFDGTVSKYITSLNSCYTDGTTDSEKEPWLFSRRGVYSEMRRGLIAFTYSIGEHGTYHSISGLGRRIFPQGNALNRAMCTMLDAAVTGSGIFMQPENEASMSKMTLVQMGGGLTLLPAKEHGEMIIRPVPDLSHGIQPLVADFRSTMGQRAGQFQGDSSPFSASTEKTRFQVAAELESLGKVGATQINLWYAPWERLLREIMRRLCRENYGDKQPGGQEAADFRRRLELRGFPLELLRAVDFDAVRAERAVGAGSGASRIGRLTQLKEYAPELGETGRRRLYRDLVAATLDGDYNQADRYIEREPEPLPTIDAQFATLENMMAEMKQEPQLSEGQNDFTHLQIHTPKLIEMVKQANMDKEAMLELAEPMLILHTHAVDTLERVQGSVIMQSEVAQYRQVLQNIGGIVDNAVRSSIAHHRNEMESSQEGQGQGGMDEGQLKMLQRAAEAEVKLQSIRDQANLKISIEAERHSQKMQQNRDEFRQKSALKDAETAGRMLSASREASVRQKAEESMSKIKQRSAEKIASIKSRSTDQNKKKE